MSALMLERPRPNRDRVDTLHEMLLRFAEAKSEASGGGGGDKRNESRLLSFDPLTFSREYRELDRCLEKLRWLAEHGRPMIEPGVSSGAAWWHLRMRYLEAVTVRREVFLRKTHSGERVPAHLPRNMEIVARATILNGKSTYMMVRVWDPGVRPEIVAAALRWISREYVGTPAVYVAA